MKTQPTITEERPAEGLGNANDDGCVLGTAGRDEDPNSTTDWGGKKTPPGHLKESDDTRGLPGYPRDDHEEELGIETPEQDNDKVG